MTARSSWSRVAPSRRCWQTCDATRKAKRLPPHCRVWTTGPLAQQIRFDLLMWYGDLFVIGAYVALFKREPDPDGFARYTALLKSGASRTFILMELCKSPEAREKSSDVRGLVRAIELYKKAQRKSWAGWYGRNVVGAESDLLADREHRALAYVHTNMALV